MRVTCGTMKSIGPNTIFCYLVKQTLAVKGAPIRSGHLLVINFLSLF